MEKESLLSLLKSPKKFETKALVGLGEAIESYPYFQPLYALKLKLLKHYGSFHYNRFLKETASRTQDRAVLFDFITSEKFSQLEVAQKIDLLIEHEKENHFTEINKDLAEQINDPNLFVEKRPKPKQQTGKPIDFKASEKHSFQEWLKLTQLKPIDNIEEPHENHSTNPQFKIIDNFIKNNPKIIPTKTYEPSEKIKAKHEPSSSLMTETLAQVYKEQKRYDKAIQAFKILILNNPEKSSFFADQIKELEKLKENKL